jgi:hypothetical protein
MPDNLDCELEIMEAIDCNDPKDVEFAKTLISHYRSDLRELREDSQLNGLVNQTLTDVLTNNQPVREVLRSLPSYASKQAFIAKITQGIERYKPRWRDEIRREKPISNPFTKGI